MGATGRRLREGWWVLAAAVVLTAATGALLVTGGQRRTAGAGPDNGFSLRPSLVPRDQLVASGMPRDGLHALDDPTMLTAAAAEATRLGAHATLLVPGDRVVGIDFAGHARAYPLRLLAWHEVVNDTVGGIPVAVTYNPLCDSVVVFDRRVAGETLHFGVSGLLFESNLLLYDRRPTVAASSLWSQLQARAVAGPAAAAGATLRLLPTAVVRWGDWRALHPDTRVLGPQPALADSYRRNPYESYFGSDILRFPVDPLPPPSDLRRKDPVVVVTVDRARAVLALARVAAAAGAPEGVFRTTVGGVPVGLHYSTRPATARLVLPQGGEHRVSLLTAFWFAWYATHPDAPPPTRPVKSEE